MFFFKITPSYPPPPLCLAASADATAMPPAAATLSGVASEAPSQPVASCEPLPSSTSGVGMQEGSRSSALKPHAPNASEVRHGSAKARAGKARVPVKREENPDVPTTWLLRIYTTVSWGWVGGGVGGWVSFLWIL